MGQFFNQSLRVVVNFTDGLGHAETLISAATSPVGINYSASANAAGVTFAGRAGNDVIVGSNFADTLRGGVGDDILTGGGGNDTLRGNGGIDTAVFTGAVTDYTLSAVTVNILVTDIAGTGGQDNLLTIERLRMGGTDYDIVMGGAGVQDVLNGGAGSQAIFGRSSADTLNGGADSDLLIGGTGNDTVNGGDGDDFIFQGSTDGRDLIDGGAGSDTYILTGTAAAETFRIYTRAEALLAGITNIAGNTEIVITRNGANNASIIAQLDNVEEIKINTLLTSANNGNGVVDSGAAGAGPSGGTGDTVVVIGDFTQTSLAYSTIRVEGSNANDTIDISGLTSAHRVVFDDEWRHGCLHRRRASAGCRQRHPAPERRSHFMSAAGSKATST